MSRTATIILVIWNFLITAVLAWLLLSDRPEARPAEMGSSDEEITEVDPPALSDRSETRLPSDTTELPESRIAYFFMDSVQDGYKLVKESADRVRREGQRLEQEFAREMERAQARAQELATKDHTYSTQAQIQADQQEYQQLEMKIQELRMSSQDKIDRLQIDMLNKIGEEVEAFLEEYNDRAGFDFIFSVQEGGQIWVGNPSLDITSDVVKGLNARHSAGKKGN